MTSDNLMRCLKDNKEFRELKTQSRSKHCEQCLQSITSQNSVADVWRNNRLIGKALRHRSFSPQKQANRLIEQWTGKFQLNSLPQGIKDQLDKSKTDRNFNSSNLWCY